MLKAIFVNYVGNPLIIVYVFHNWVVVFIQNCYGVEATNTSVNPGRIICPMV